MCVFFYLNKNFFLQNFESFKLLIQVLGLLAHLSSYITTFILDAY